jgi:hypothetical protein
LQPWIARYKFKSGASSRLNAARTGQRPQINATGLNREFNEGHGVKFQACARLYKAARFAEVAHPAAKEGARSKDENLRHGIEGVTRVASSVLFSVGHGLSQVPGTQN